MSLSSFVSFLSILLFLFVLSLNLSKESTLCYVSPSKLVVLSFPLYRNEGEFSKFILEYSIKEKDEEEDKVEEFAIVSQQEDKAMQSGVRRQRSSASTSKEDAGEKTALIQKEVTEEGNVKLAVYQSYLRAIGYDITILLALLLVLSYAASVGSNFWLSDWSSQVGSNSTSEGFSLAVNLGVYGALGMGNAVGLLIVTLVLAYGSIRASRSKHNDMLNCVMRAPMSFFDTTPMGRVVNRFAKDIYVVDETIPRSLRSYLQTLMQVGSC